MKEIFSISFSVFYEDTDSSGFTYHTSYLKFAERARSIMVKENFKEIFDKMLKNTFFFVVRKITVKYIKPSFLSDELLVKTYFLKSNKVSLDLSFFCKQGLIVISPSFRHLTNIVYPKFKMFSKFFLLQRIQEATNCGVWNHQQ